MAERRMISKRVIDTDRFLDMPISSRLLYYDLLIRADDDGFVGSPRKITRMIGADDNDLQNLVDRHFVIRFPSGICVIRDWRIHNYIKPDRYQQTQYISEKNCLKTGPGKEYELIGSTPDTERSQSGSTPDTQVRVEIELGKSNTPIAPSGGESKQSESLKASKAAQGSGTSGPVDHSTTSAMQFSEFWDHYPRKVGKTAAERTFKKLKPSTALFQTILAALDAQKCTEQWQRDGGQYIPYPATWLNGRRWEDEIQNTGTNRTTPDFSDPGSYHEQREEDLPAWATAPLKHSKL